MPARSCLGIAVVIVLFSIFALPLPAFAGDDWRKHWGGGKHAPNPYYMGDYGEHEWYAGNCKYKYKSDHRGYREEAKCKRGPYIALLPPTPFIPRGQVHADGPPPNYVLGPQVSAAEAGRYCREYQRTVTIGGKPEASYGRACWQPDGSWEIVD